MELLSPTRMHFADLQCQAIIQVYNSVMQYKAQYIDGPCRCARSKSCATRGGNGSVTELFCVGYIFVICTEYSLIFYVFLAPTKSQAHGSA